MSEEAKAKNELFLEEKKIARDEFNLVTAKIKEGGLSDAVLAKFEARKLELTTELFN